jgi:hypothetical protein
MNRYVIAITGAHKIVRRTAGEILKDSKGGSYHHAIEDDLRTRAVCQTWAKCQVFDELLMSREFTRDEQILCPEADFRCALIEQWHIGNLAAVRARCPDIAQAYEIRLHKQLAELRGVEVIVFYVSTDLAKLSTVRIGEFYGRYLEQLSVLERQLGFPLHTIDGEAGPESMRRRLSYLVHQFI